MSSHEFLSLLNSLDNNKKKKNKKEPSKRIVKKEDEKEEEPEDYKKFYEFFDVNRLNNEFEKLMNDIEEVKTHSKHLENILNILKTDMDISSKITTKISNESSNLKINTFDTSITTLALSQKLVHDRIINACNKILLYNNEKDNNLKVFFNNYASKYIEFNELMHQKGVKILYINGDNITPVDKKRALLLLNQIDIKSDSKDTHPNSNDKAFAFIDSTKNTINITSENRSLIINEK